MQDAALVDRRSFAPDREAFADATGSEAFEVAQLLTRAGVDHASSLWFQLLELATQQACDWSERAAESATPLSPRAAALLGLRTLAADLLITIEEDDATRVAAEACLAICAETTEPAAGAPPRRRRWGEGSLSPPPPHPRLLQRSAGCC